MVGDDIHRVEAACPEDGLSELRKGGAETAADNGCFRIGGLDRLASAGEQLRVFRGRAGPEVLAPGLVPRLPGVDLVVVVADHRLHITAPLVPMHGWRAAPVVVTRLFVAPPSRPQRGPAERAQELVATPGEVLDVSVKPDVVPGRRLDLV